MEMVVSVGAFLVSLIALYLSHWHKSSKAILCLNSRFFDCLSEKTNRELNYTFSNTGNQELYIKDIALLMGPSPLGHLKHDAPYLEVPINHLDPFVLKPGEIRPFTVVHDAAYRPPKESDPNQHRHTILSLEVISANGKRYQVAHDISELGATGPALKHPIWKGVPLGSSV
ncbi:hypothetical protein DFO83_103283 [Idiomarina loihiensis]|uniref:Uncharacterized protein n=1 Tax=Halomonas alimentaria TaxID=147248 RepID=A0A7X4W7Z7_9GAMM|nr:MULTISPECIES: hypothetical protein [Gammaproteobacteria]NAW35708.1 hypothetical protein [Halomonas alimentaria]PWW39373.1 hypothetical protein DFO83_103283 [Idiomarina loihiensis]TDP49532.1 hypothetical protein DET58_103116 [Idiomarina loihiensis]TDS24154.1 hypothetical protein DET62_103283 [Idiomarina sp. H2]